MARPEFRCYRSNGHIYVSADDLVDYMAKLKSTVETEGEPVQALFIPQFCDVLAGVFARIARGEGEIVG